MLDRKTFEMAEKAMEAAVKATMSIDAHVVECARNYEHMTFTLKWLLGVLSAGTLLIITALGAVAWALFEYVINNPRLLAT
jgi:16S rRNA G1207 methylase RsmC